MYQTDLVITELRKAPEQKLSKKALQEATALGTDDLRSGLEGAVEAGFVTETDDGYEYREDGDIQAVVPAAAQPKPVIAVGETAAAAEEGEGPADDVPEELRDHEPPELNERTGLDPAYRATYETEVEYRTDDPGAGDEQGLAEAAQIAAALTDGLLSKFPDLTVRITVKRVVVFDNAREIFRA